MPAHTASLRGIEMRSVQDQPRLNVEFTDYPEEDLKVSKEKYRRRYIAKGAVKPQANDYRPNKRNTQLVEIGNNKEGRKGKLRCERCRTRRSKALSHLLLLTYWF